MKKYKVVDTDIEFDVEVWSSIGNQWNRYMLDTPDGVYFVASVQLHGIELIDVLSESTLDGIRGKVSKLCWLK